MSFLFDQHMQCSSLILVIQNLVPPELLIVHNIIDRISHFETMNPWSFRGDIDVLDIARTAGMT